MSDSRIEEAVRREDPGALVRIAAEEATRRDRSGIYSVLGRLGAVAKVAFSDRAQTARIGLRGGEIRLEFGPTFVREHLKTPADLLHLLLHELLHAVRGDLQRPRPAGISASAWPQIANFAADMLVNADLENLLLGETPAFVRGFYSRDAFPACLLLPPWMFLALERDRARALMLDELQGLCRDRFAELGVPDPARVARVYVSAWTQSPPFEWLIDELRRILPERPTMTIVWLGNHDGWGEPGLARLLADLGIEVDTPPGHGDIVEEEETPAPPISRRSRAFLEAVRAALANDPSRPRRRPATAVDRGVVPFLGRREAFLLAGGCWPVFFPQTVQAPDEDERRVHLYVDVSGSTRRHWAMLYGLILHAVDEIGEPVYQFSNAVRPANFADLRAGQVDTTGGTDFDCVAEDALSRRFRRILVMTDGCADLDEALARRLRRERVEIFVVLTESCPHCPLVGPAQRVWEIPSEAE